ncbi:MAG: hypothetical protein WC119_00995 [Synergistaceae bacterium]
MNKTILILLGTILMVGCSTLNQRETDDFTTLYNRLFENEIKTNFDIDKQYHAIASKPLFTLAMVSSTASNAASAHLEGFMRAYQTGLQKELRDQGVSEGIISNAFDAIYEALEEIDVITTENRLDVGDLMADLFGIGSSLVICSDISVIFEQEE